MRAKSLSIAKERAPAGGSRGREIVGILLLSIGLFFGLSLVSLLFGQGTLMGPGGRTVALGLYGAFGVGALLVAAAILRGAIKILAAVSLTPLRLDTLGEVGGTLALLALLDLCMHARVLEGHPPGGALGALFGGLLHGTVGVAGGVLVCVGALACAIVLATTVRLRALGEIALLGAARVPGLLRTGATGAASALRVVVPRRSDDDDKSKDRLTRNRKTLSPAQSAHALVPVPEVEKEAKRKRAKRDLEDALAALVDGRSDDASSAASPSLEEPARGKKKGKGAEDAAAPDLAEPSQAAKAEAARSDPADEDEAPPFDVDEPEEEPAEEQPKIIESKYLAPVAPKTEARVGPDRPAPDYSRHELPQVALLDYFEPVDATDSQQQMLDTARRLVEALRDLGIDGHVAQINPGPVVTVYEFVPKRGTKVSKVEALSKDVAMALEAVKVRIVAPIPGKNAIGFEVPNRKRQTVFLKEILCDEGFSSAKSNLQMGLGRDIEGRPVSIDLQKMPHLLVAGTTGSGKSVSVNAMLVSLLYKSSPEDLRLILIDPKMLEFSTYEGIPHLLLPVVTDPKKANLVLRWACEEMERRYETLMHAGVRNIESYNRKVAKAVEAAMSGAQPCTQRQAIKVRATGPDGVEREVMVEAEAEDQAAAAASLPLEQPLFGLSEQTAPQKLPYIVIVIDELADLMMVASKEVESSVMRLAQKARAAGIHLVLATQRPSTNVINGVIKANFPSRIAFQVSSSTDSRVILDQNGAESLLGHGDMLFSDRGATLRRVHGALVTEEEVHRVVEHLKKQGKPSYDLEILRAPDDDGPGGGPSDEPADEFYDQAVRHVAETRQVSVSGIQRKFKIGYNRAARIVERMERESVVGPQEGIKPREVLVQAP